MKNWMKQQVTEITFWAGLVMVVGYFLLPKIVMLIIGVLLIAIDDVKARKWVLGVERNYTPWVWKILLWCRKAFPSP